MAYSMMQLKRYLDSKNWKYQQHGDNAVGLRLKTHVVESCIVRMDILSENTAVFRTFFPILIAEEKREHVLRYLDLVNTRLNCGSFQMNLANGEIQYRLGQFADSDEEMELERIGRLVNMGCYIIDRFGAGILGVLYQDEAPESALMHVEKITAAAHRRAVEAAVKKAEEDKKKAEQESE